MNYCCKCGEAIPVGLMWCSQCQDLQIIEETKKKRYATAVLDKKTLEAQKNSKDTFSTIIPADLKKIK